MTLQQKLDAFKADFKSGKPPYNAPPEIHPIMERATRELIASGLAQRALKAGDKAPDFTLPDPNGRAVSSAVLLADDPLIVSFYRGVWCPYCNLELQALQEALPKFREFGANVVAISPQTSSNSRKSTRTNALEFPILSDAHNNLAAAFGLRVDSAIMVSGLRCGVPRQAASASGSRVQIVVMQRCERIDECFECFDYRRVRRVKRW